MSDPQVTAARPIARVASGERRERVDDAVAVERALEIRIDGRTLAVTLRTPGHDRRAGARASSPARADRARAPMSRAVRERAAACAGRARRGRPSTLAPGVRARLDRASSATSPRPRRAGLCGRAHLDVAARRPHADCRSAAPLDPTALVGAARAAARCAGGVLGDRRLHAAALCDDDARAAGAARGRRPPQRGRQDRGLAARAQAAIRRRAACLWVSGRAGAEIVLKAARARIPVLAGGRRAVVARDRAGRGGADDAHRVPRR